jgi:hypothetical protein
MGKSNEETNEDKKWADSHYSWARATPWIGNKPHVDGILQAEKVADQHEPWLKDTSGDQGNGRPVRRLPERKGYDWGHGD